MIIMLLTYPRGNDLQLISTMPRPPASLLVPNSNCVMVVNAPVTIACEIRVEWLHDASRIS